MIKSYKVHSFSNGLKFSILGTLKANKAKIIITLMLVLVAIFTGVFVAIKTNSNMTLGRLQDIDLSDFHSGFVASSSAFLARCLSLCVNVFLLTLLAFVPVLFPLAEILFIYRGYLFGLNFALLFIFYGLGGMFTAVIIILPCQLLTLFVLIFYYLTLCKINANRKRYGTCECNRFVFVSLGILTLFVCNLLETLLLVLLNGKVILVI